MISPLVAQTFESSSIVTSVISELAPMPPYSSSNMIPKRSFSRKSSTTSHGNSADLSISAARGAIRSRAIVANELADLALLVGQRIEGAHGASVVAVLRISPAVCCRYP